MIKITDNNLTQFNGLLNLWQKSNRQLKKKLLCEDCEQLLGKNETLFSEIFKSINLEKNKGLYTYVEFDEEQYNELAEKGFSKNDIDGLLVDNPIYDKLEIIRYFSVSYMFRELINNPYDVSENELKKIRLFLQNKCDFPFMLTVRVHDGQPEFNLFSTVIVMDSLPDWKHYVFYIPNMQFHVALNINGTPEHMNKTFITLANFFTDEIGTLNQLKKYQSSAKIAHNLKKT